MRGEGGGWVESIHRILLESDDYSETLETLNTFDRTSFVGEKEEGRAQWRR